MIDDSSKQFNPGGRRMPSGQSDRITPSTLSEEGPAQQSTPPPSTAEVPVREFEPVQPMVCMLLQNSPSFVLHTRVDSVQDDGTPVSASALIDTGADFNVLSVRLLDKVGANREEYIFTEAALEDISCKDANGKPMVILGVLQKKLTFTMRASDLSVVTFSLDPHITFDDQNPARRPRLICSYSPAAIILGVPWQAANEVSAAAATMSIHCGGRTFAKNFQSAHSRASKAVQAAVSSRDPQATTVVTAVSHNQFTCSALPVERHDQIPVLEAYMMPLWIPDLALFPKGGELVIFPSATLYEETGLYFTPMTINRANPCVFITNSNLCSVSVSNYKEIGVVSVFYSGGIHTHVKERPANTASSSTAARYTSNQQSLGVSPVIVTQDAHGPGSAAETEWCTSSGDPLLKLDASLPASHLKQYRALVRKYERVFHNDFSKDSRQTTPAEIKLKPDAVPFMQIPSVYRQCITTL